jgi:uncharacterized membrane protein YdjX (TVP38/TMEM64 family)
VAQRNVVLRYADSHPGTVLAGWGACYVLMQSLAIPGTLTLSLLSGALWGPWLGFALVSVVNVVGSSACYALSAMVGRAPVHALWPDRLTTFSAEVKKRRQHMLNYILFLRATPVVPNVFINVASPIVGVPLVPFALGTLFGCMPNNFVAVGAGARLGELKSLRDFYDGRMVVLGLAAGAAAMLPVYLQRHGAAVKAPRGDYPGS